MGLDMSLCTVKRNEIAYWRKANAIHAWFSRKFESITGKELENCQDFFVTKEDLIELRNICEKVLKSSELVYKEVSVGEQFNPESSKFEKVYRPCKAMKDSSLAEELLPTQSGFFFGSTEYTEGYIEDLKSTIDQINKILETVDFEEYDIAYSASW